MKLNKLIVALFLVLSLIGCSSQTIKPIQITPCVTNCVIHPIIVPYTPHEEVPPEEPHIIIPER